MFETSVVRTHVESPRGRFSLLTISLVAHTAVVIGVIAVSIASVGFPKAAPDEFAQAPSFLPVRIPPPLGTPNGSHSQAQAARPKATAPPAPNQLTAPQQIPETVQNAAPVGATGADNGSASGSGGSGVPWGEKDSIGEIDAPPLPVPQQPVEQKIYVVGGEVKSPVLVHRVEPSYPQVLIRTRLSATVVVRCVIDRNGRVRDPQIVVGALPPFNAAVVDAVQKWRFTPGSLHGEAVETYLDLTVNFAVR